MGGSRRNLAVAVLLGAALLGGACGGGGGSGQVTGTTLPGETVKQGGVFRQSMSEPAFIDPYNASEANGVRVVRRLFVGLTTFDGNQDQAMRPGVAETWTTSTDCTQWTFKLRTSTFSNGEEVTADSFIRGWTRAADGKAASRVASNLAGVQGYDQLHASSSASFSGLSAPDPHTLVVKLAAADCEFDKKTLHPVMSPVPSVAGAFDNRAYSDAPVGNGPFMMKPGSKWQHDVGISLVRNDTYFGTKPHLDGIELLITPSSATATVLSALDARDVDAAEVPAGQRAAASAKYGPDGGFLKKVAYSTSYISVNTAKGVLSNPDARRAVSLALDRDLIAKAVAEGFVTAADALVPPPFGVQYQPGVCDACHLDPVKAKELATKAGLTPATHLRFVGSGSAGAPLPLELKSELERVLGVSVDLQILPLAEAQARQASGDFDLASFSWNADYPAAEDFLYPLLGTGSGENHSGYSNAELDGLIRQSRTERDAVARRRLLQSAERLAIGRDVALVPVYFRTTLVAFDASKWTGLDIDFFGQLTYESISLK